MGGGGERGERDLAAGRIFVKEALPPVPSDCLVLCLLGNRNNWLGLHLLTTETRFVAVVFTYTTRSGDYLGSAPCRRDVIVPGTH